MLCGVFFLPALKKFASSLFVFHPLFFSLLFPSSPSDQRWMPYHSLFLFCFFLLSAQALHGIRAIRSHSISKALVRVCVRRRHRTDAPHPRFTQRVHIQLCCAKKQLSAAFSLSPLLRAVFFFFSALRLQRAEGQTQSTRINGILKRE